MGLAETIATLIIGSCIPLGIILGQTYEERKRQPKKRKKKTFCAPREPDCPDPKDWPDDIF